MKKILALCSLLGLAFLSPAQLYSPNAVIRMPAGFGGAGTQIKAATTFWYCIFKAPATDTLASFTYFNGSANGGTVTNIGTAEVFLLDASYKPTGAALATQVFTPAGQNAAPIAVTFSSPPAVTQNSYYCVRVKNTDAAPTTNFFGMPVATSTSGAWQGPIFSSTSTDNQATLTGPVPMNSCWVTLTTFGVYRSITTQNTGLASSVHIFNTSGSRVAYDGWKCNFPIAYKLWKVSCPLVLTGTTGLPTLKCVVLDASNVVLATSANTWANGTANLNATFYFTGGYALPVGSVCRIVITPVNATDGDSTDYYTLTGQQSPSGDATDGGAILGGYGSTATSPSWSSDGDSLSLYMDLKPISTSGTSGGRVIGGGLDLVLMLAALVAIRRCL